MNLPSLDPPALVQLSTLLNFSISQSQRHRESISKHHPAMTHPKLRLWLHLHDMEHYAKEALREVERMNS